MRYLALVLAIAMSGCIPDVQFPTANEVVDIAGENADKLDKALELTRAGLAVTRVAAAEVCVRFPNTCQDLAKAGALAEKYVAEAQNAVNVYRENKGDMQAALRAVAAAQVAVNDFIDAVTRVMSNVASQ